MPATQAQVVEYIKEAKVTQLKSLIDTLETELGVSAQPQFFQNPDGPQPEPEPEQTEFSVFLKHAGKERIKVIKAIRVISGLGLKEAKAAVEEIPSEIKTGLPKVEAEKVAKELRDAGATVEVQ